MNSCILPGTFRIPSEATLVDLVVRCSGRLLRSRRPHRKKFEPATIVCIPSPALRAGRFQRYSAPADDGVERIRKEAARTAVEAVDVAEVPGLLEVALYEAPVANVVEAVPDLDRLCGKAAVGERDRHRRTFLQHPPDFAEHFHGSG